MLIVLAAAVVLSLVVLVGEALVARRGVVVDVPDVATLSAVHTPEASRGDIRLLWLGDSTAAAVGTSSPEFAVSTNVGAAVSSLCSVTVRTRVIAKSGATVGDVLRDQAPLVAELGTDVVMISVGANDTTRLTSPAFFTQQYAKVIDALVLAGVAPDHIVLIGVPDMGSPPRLLQPLRAIVSFRARRLDTRVHTLAEERGTRYVDLFAGTSAPFRKHPTRYFAADKYHPSDNGYAVWARAITPVVAPICS